MNGDTDGRRICAGTPRHAGGRCFIPVILKYRWSSGDGMFVSETPLGIYVVDGDEEYYYPLVPEEDGYLDAENFEEVRTAIRTEIEVGDQ